MSACAPRTTTTSTPSRRQIHDAERDNEYSTRRLDEIGQDIGRLVPTFGEAFVVTALGKPYTGRKDASRAVMKEILTLVLLEQEGEVPLATVGGFDLVFDGERIGKDGFRDQTVLQRTAADYEIDLAVTVTPLGAILRLEHALDGFEDEQRRYRQLLDRAESGAWYPIDCAMAVPSPSPTN